MINWLLSQRSRQSVSDSSAESLPLSSREEPPLLWRLADRFNWDRDLVACTLCELFCSCFFLYGGTSIGAGKVATNATFDYVNPIGWGLWLVITLYVGYNISGAHMNPAVSFLHLTMGNISWRRFICYSLAQFSGCFLGAALTYLVYYDGLQAFDGGVRAVYGPTGSADIFATYPKPYLSIMGGIVDQFATTAVLCIMLLSITDSRNNIPRQAQPLLIGIGLWAIVALWSQNCGAALNPARDFGPRLFTFVAGYGWEVFSYRSYTWFMVPIVAPMFGAVAGGYIYRRFIGYDANTSPDYPYLCSVSIGVAHLHFRYF